MEWTLSITARTRQAWDGPFGSKGLGWALRPVINLLRPEMGPSDQICAVSALGGQLGPENRPWCAVSSHQIDDCWCSRAKPDICFVFILLLFFSLVNLVLKAAVHCLKKAVNQILEVFSFGVWRLHWVPRDLPSLTKS